VFLKISVSVKRVLNYMFKKGIKENGFWNKLIKGI